MLCEGSVMLPVLLVCGVQVIIWKGGTMTAAALLLLLVMLLARRRRRMRLWMRMALWEHECVANVWGVGCFGQQMVHWTPCLTPAIPLQSEARMMCDPGMNHDGFTTGVPAQLWQPHSIEGHTRTRDTVEGSDASLVGYI
jgi:MYXO-CTERM domain-containing protein